MTSIIETRFHESILSFITELLEIVPNMTKLCIAKIFIESSNHSFIINKYISTLEPFKDKLLQRDESILSSIFEDWSISKSDFDYFWGCFDEESRDMVWDWVFALDKITNIYLLKKK